MRLAVPIRTLVLPCRKRWKAWMNKLLDPRRTWSDSKAYDRQARDLVQMFIANFGKFGNSIDASVMNASPQYAIAAE